MVKFKCDPPGTTAYATSRDFGRTRRDRIWKPPDVSHHRLDRCNRYRRDFPRRCCPVDDGDVLAQPIV